LNSVILHQSHLEKKELFTIVLLNLIDTILDSDNILFKYVNLFNKMDKAGTY